MLAWSFSGFAPWLRENVRARNARRIVFSIVLSRQPSPALLFFKLIEVETKFPFANSISTFSRSQDPKRTLAAASNLRLERPHSGAKPIFHRSGYSRLMGADEAPAKGQSRQTPSCRRCGGRLPYPNEPDLARPRVSRARS